jgi:hypothetical protein
MQIETLGVYKPWQNEEVRIIWGVCLHLFTFRLNLSDGDKKRQENGSGLCPKI